MHSRTNSAVVCTYRGPRQTRSVSIRRRREIERRGNRDHRMRNLAAKVPEDVWPEFKARATACYQAPSRAIARDLADGVVAGFERELPSAMPI